MKLHFIVYSFLLLSLSSKSMDDPRWSKKTVDIGTGVAEYKKKINIWNNDAVISAGTKWTDAIPRNLIITPDEKGAVIALPGSVVYVNFDNINGLSEPCPLIKYAHNTNMYCPIIAVAMQKNKVLVASVLNGIKNKPQLKAECTISHNNINQMNQKSHDIFSRKWYETKELDSDMVQALRFSCDGTVLAAAFQDSIQVKDLLSGKNRTSSFLPRVKQDYVVDVSAPHGCLTHNEQRIAAVNNKGIVDFKKFQEEDGEITISNIKDVSTGELIETVHFFETQELLYVTQLGEVKIINPYDWLEHFKGNIKNRTISHHAGNKAAIDQNLQHGTIHWIDHADLPENSRFQIHVHRENGTETESFVITMPSDLPKTYNFINAMGQLKSQATHLLLAALRGNTVVALATDGYLYRWQLPKQYIAPNEQDVKSDITRKDRIKRSVSSAHESIKTRPRSSTDAEEKKRNEKDKDKRKSIRIPRGKLGSKEVIKSSSPRKEKEIPSPREKKDAENLQTLHSIGDIQEYIQTLERDISNDYERLEKK